MLPCFSPSVLVLIAGLNDIRAEPVTVGAGYEPAVTVGHVERQDRLPLIGAGGLPFNDECQIDPVLCDQRERQEQGDTVLAG